MTKTELLALAERLDDAPGVLGMLSRADLAEAASILRKLAALEPVAWAVVGSNVFCDGLYTRQAFATASASSRNDGSRVEPLHNLTGIIDHE